MKLDLETVKFVDVISIFVNHLSSLKDIIRSRSPWTNKSHGSSNCISGTHTCS